MEYETNLWIHVIEDAEHASLFRSRWDVTKVVCTLDLFVPESVRELKSNLDEVWSFNKSQNSNLFGFVLTKGGHCCLCPLTKEYTSKSRYLICHLWNDLIELWVTFSMIPAPRLWIAFSFLSGSGGLKWMRFFWSNVSGIVTRTWNERGGSSNWNSP